MKLYSRNARLCLLFWVLALCAGLGSTAAMAGDSIVWAAILSTLALVMVFTAAVLDPRPPR